MSGGKKEKEGKCSRANAARTIKGEWDRAENNTSEGELNSGWQQLKVVDKGGTLHSENGLATPHMLLSIHHCMVCDTVISQASHDY